MAGFEKFSCKDSKGKKIELRVYKDADGVVEKMEIPGKKMRSYDRGSIQELKLANERGQYRTPITHAADNSVIVTHSSPECYWYFLSGRWYRICIGE